LADVVPSTRKDVTPEHEEREDPSGPDGVGLMAMVEVAQLAGVADDVLYECGERTDEEQELDALLGSAAAVAKGPPPAVVLEVSKVLLDLHPNRVEVDDLLRATGERRRQDERFVRVLAVVPVVGVVVEAPPSFLPSVTTHRWLRKNHAARSGLLGRKGQASDVAGTPAGRPMQVRAGQLSTVQVYELVCPANAANVVPAETLDVVEPLGFETTVGDQRRTTVRWQDGAKTVEESSTARSLHAVGPNFGGPDRNRSPLVSDRRHKPDHLVTDLDGVDEHEHRGSLLDHKPRNRRGDPSSISVEKLVAEQAIDRLDGMFPHRVARQGPTERGQPQLLAADQRQDRSPQRRPPRCVHEGNRLSDLVV